MKNTLIAVLGVITVAALIAFIYTQMKGVADRAATISEEVVTPYVGLLRDARYEDAWNCCLSDGYKAQVSLAEFTAAQAAHVQNHGPLRGWREGNVQHEADLFSSESLIGLNGVLEYEERDVFVLYKVDSAAEPLRIMQVFGSPDRSDSLSEGIW